MDSMEPGCGNAARGSSAACDDGDDGDPGTSGVTDGCSGGRPGTAPLSSGSPVISVEGGVTGDGSRLAFETAGGSGAEGISVFGEPDDSPMLPVSNCCGRSIVSGENGGLLCCGTPEVAGCDSAGLEASTCGGCGCFAISGEVFPGVASPPAGSLASGELAEGV